MATDRTIACLALLKSEWDEQKKDYIEIFIPLAATLMVRKSYSEVDPATLSEDFEKEYGLTIPYHPMCTILNRLRKRKMLDTISSKDRKYHPKLQELETLNISTVQQEHLRKQEKLLASLVHYAKEHYDVILTQAEAEEAFIDFLHQYDVQVLMTIQKQSMLPRVKYSKQARFLVSKAIEHAVESEPALAGYFADAAIGHIIASTILYDDYDEHYSGRLKKLHLYLDTPVLLPIVCGKRHLRYSSTCEFLRLLQQQGAILLAFEHTQDELYGILSQCRRIIDSGNIDLRKASNVLRFFWDKGYTSSDLDLIISDFSHKLRSSGITVALSPDYENSKLLQIDELRLYKSIRDEYQRTDRFFDEESKKTTIEKDIKSISSIYHLRGGKAGPNLSSARCILVTTNATLAYICKKFASQHSEFSQSFPVCITDVFLGTVAWLYSPAEKGDISKRIIADCYAATQPDQALIGKFLEQVETLTSEGSLTEEQCYLLRTERTCLNLLGEKTLGDPDNITEYTSHEILEMYVQRSKEYLSLKVEADGQRKELESEKEEHETTKRNIRRRAKHLAQVLSWASCVLVFCVFLLSFFWSFDGIFRWMCIFVMIGVSIMNLWFGIGFVNVQELMAERIEKKVLRFLTR